MAQMKPLRMKVQRTSNYPRTVQGSNFVAKVILDTGIFHLDYAFDYAVPLKLQGLIAFGQRVNVPFGKKSFEGLVVDLQVGSELTQLKEITSIISPHPVLSRSSLELILESSKRWACHPFDIIRSAIPPRVAAVDKSFSTEHVQPTAIKKGRLKRIYYQFEPGEDEFASLATQARQASESGQVLVVLPDVRDVDRFESSLSGGSQHGKFLRLDASTDRATRYLNFLHATGDGVDIVYGTRSCVFAPLPNLVTIILHRDVSESHYEPRSPGWNARDIAIIRSMHEGCSLIVSGYSPSSEVSRLIEIKWMQVIMKKSKVVVTALVPKNGELLPDRSFQLIRTALKTGPVLFLTPRKGYATAMMCSKCKNIGICECGGKLHRTSSTSQISCSVCSLEFQEWRCKWCGGEKALLLGRGSARYSEEIGRAFSGFRVISSEGHSIQESIDSEPALVISTPGSVPFVKGGYSAVIILDATSLLFQSDLRGQERAREQIFSAASKVGSSGHVGIVIESDNPIVSSVARWNPSILSQRELRERLEVNLPPYVRSISIETESSRVTQLVNGLRKAVTEDRLPKSVRILGPSKSRQNFSRVILLCELKDAADSIDFMHEYARRQSMSKKPLDSLRVDPYSLT